MHVTKWVGSSRHTLVAGYRTWFHLASRTQCARYCQLHLQSTRHPTAATSRTVSIPVAQSSTLTRQGLPIALLCTQARENRACHSMGCQPRTRRTARPRWVYLLRHCNRVVGKHRNGSDGPTTVVGCDCARLNLAAAAAAAAGSVCRSQSPNQSHSSVIPSMSFFCFRAFPVHFAVQFAPALRLHTVELRECTRPRPATSLGQYPVPAPLFNPPARRPATSLGQ